MQLLQSLAPYITSLGLLGAFLYVIAREKKSGIAELDQQIIQGYKERNSQLEESFKRVQEQIKELTAQFNEKFTAQAKEISKLTGIVEEKDKHIVSLTALLQGRNPEVMNILGEIKDLNKKIIDFLQIVHDKISRDMGYQNKKLDVNEKRNEKIDHDTEEGKGKTMRFNGKNNKK